MKEDVDFSKCLCDNDLSLYKVYDYKFIASRSKIGGVTQSRLMKLGDIPEICLGDIPEICLENLKYKSNYNIMNLDNVLELKNLKSKEYNPPYLSTSVKKYKSYNPPFILDNNYYNFIWKISNYEYILELFIPKVSINLIKLYNELIQELNKKSFNNQNKNIVSIVTYLSSEIYKIFNNHYKSELSNKILLNHINEDINIIINKIKEIESEEDLKLPLDELNVKMNEMLLIINSNSDIINYNVLFNKDIDENLYKKIKYILPKSFENINESLINESYVSSKFKLTDDTISIKMNIRNINIVLTEIEKKRIELFFSGKKEKYNKIIVNNKPYKITLENNFNKLNHTNIMKELYDNSRYSINQNISLQYTKLREKIIRKHKNIDKTVDFEIPEIPEIPEIQEQLLINEPKHLLDKFVNESEFITANVWWFINIDNNKKITSDDLKRHFEFKDINENFYKVNSIDNHIVHLDFRPNEQLKKLKIFNKDNYEKALTINHDNLNVIGWNNKELDISNAYNYMTLLVRYSNNDYFYYNENNIPLGFEKHITIEESDSLFSSFIDYNRNNKLKIEIYPNKYNDFFISDNRIVLYIRVILSLYLQTYNNIDKIIKEKEDILHRLSLDEYLLNNIEIILNKNKLLVDMKSTKEQLFLDYLIEISDNFNYIDTLKEIAMEIVKNIHIDEYTTKLSSGDISYYSSIDEILLLCNLYNINIWLFQDLIDDKKQLNIYKPEILENNKTTENKLCDENSGISCGEYGQCFKIDNYDHKFDKSKIDEYPNYIFEKVDEDRINYNCSFINVQGTIKRTIFLNFNGIKNNQLLQGHYDSLNLKFGIVDINPNKIRSKIISEIDNKKLEKYSGVKEILINTLLKEYNKKLEDSEINLLLKQNGYSEERVYDLFNVSDDSDSYLGGSNDIESINRIKFFLRKIGGVNDAKINKNKYINNYKNVFNLI